MPILNWIGKEKVINHHQEVPYKVLDQQYNFNSEQTSENKIIHGDNLEALKALLPEYEGKIKCIYIDPPYNTGNESWVYNDNVNHPKIKKWLGQVVGKESEDLTRHDKWLCMMYPRLKLLHKLLSDDGAIFISIDDNEQANLKLICDEIFGGGNFITNFIWKKKGGVSNTEKLVGNLIEYILCYSKNPIKFKTNRRTIDKKFNLEDENGYYTLEGLLKTDEGEYKRDTMKFGIINPKTNTTIYPPQNKRWIIGEKKKNELLQRELLHFDTDKNGNEIVRLKKYKTEEGVSSVYYNLILDNGSLLSAKNQLEEMNFEREGFSTPKPTQLLDFLLQISSDPNSIILDSFAGSATTAHAVLNINKQDGGNRKFILVEMEDYAESITAERVKRVINGYADKEGTGGSFTYYKLGQPLFIGDNSEYINEAVGIEKIRQYIWYSETRTSLTPTLSKGEGEKKKQISNNEFFLGKKDETAYYFIYEKDELTTLDYETLATIDVKAGSYVLYADNCLLPKEFMLQHNIVFKKIPRDITRF